MVIDPQTIDPTFEGELSFMGKLSFMGELQFAPTMGHKHCQYIANEGK